MNSRGDAASARPPRNSSLTAADPVLLFAAAVLATAVRCLYLQPVPVTRGEMDAVALTLARQGFFGNPFPLTGATGPTAFVPPLYPYFISLFIRIFGEQGYFLPLTATTTLVYGLHIALLPRLSEKLLGARNPGLWAAATCIVAPVLLWVPHWDAMYTATALVLFALNALRLKSAQGWLTPVSCGLMAGVIALLNPTSLLVSLPFAFLAGWENPHKARLFPVFLAMTAVPIAPWVARNHAVLDTLSFRTNFGVTLYASNNDCAQPSLLASIENGCHDAHHPFGSFQQTAELRALGEAAYDRSRRALALAWIESHPSAFLHLTILRIVEFWFPPSIYRSYAVSCWVITGIAAAGLFPLRREHRLFFRFSLVVFAIYPLLYYVVISDPRYRYPILWISLLAYGYAVEISRLHMAGGQKTSTPRAPSTSL